MEPSRKIIVRYSLLQIPALLLLMLVLLLVRRWVNLPFWLFWGIISLWVIKDVVLFFFTWRAYDWERRGDTNSLIGAHGTAYNRLDPVGHVGVQGELWQARIEEGSQPIEAGEKLQVMGIQGLTLLVERCDERMEED